MIGALLKSYLPRGLMGRAALILVLPVAGLLLIVSVAVIQRHYDRVTRQMTAEFARIARHVVAEAEVAAGAGPGAAAARAAELGAAFGLAVSVGPAPGPAAEPHLPLWELSARLARHELRLAFPDRSALAVLPDRVRLALPLAVPEGTAGAEASAGEGAGAAVVFEMPLSRLTASNPHQLLVVTLLAAALMTWIAFAFLRNQLRPIRRLARAAEAFGRGESVPVKVSGATEVRAAAQAFLDMRARIEAQIEQRTLMLSGVSHDLRTPITRMRLALDLMGDEAEAAGLREDLAQMEALIDRYLDFVRDGAAEPVAEADLAALVAARVAAAARGGGRVALVPPPSGLPRPALRPALFARALDNLIANALRYGRRAVVRIEAGPAELAVVVEDDGPGIPPERRAEALRPFARLEGARTADGGVGLGLAIAADALRSHGGRVELGQGETPGLGGLAARLVLPRAPR